MNRTGIEFCGVISEEELKKAGGFPSQKRQAKGPVAVIECIQEIPCNPCEAACPHKAIHVGLPITNCPVLHEDICIGCGLCIAKCPGLAIFVVDETYGKTEGSVSFPYEYLDLPEEGEIVEALDRHGQKVCDGRVIKLLCLPSYSKTVVATVAVPKEMVNQVRNMRRKGNHG